MSPFKIDGNPIAVEHKKISIPPCDPIDWLSSQPLYPKVYWKERNCTVEHAAVGEILHFSHLPRLTGSDPHVRLYGGMRFECKKQDPLWEKFDQVRFWMPQCELLYTEEKRECIVHSLNGSFYTPQQPMPTAMPEPMEVLERVDLPERSEWNSILERILKAIDDASLEKVVSARKTELQLLHTPSVWQLLKHLRSRSFNTTLFAFELSPGLCFFGSTPEKLFERKGVHLFTEAVAGTRRRAATAQEDDQIARELLSNPKDYREFQIVKEFLEKRVAEHAESTTWEGEDRILQNTHVQHIYNRLSATLHRSVSDAELVQSLHPTPALGGFPSTEALAMIAKHEPFDRGWYGAPVGILSPQKASFAVAIRSGLLSNNSLHLFAGTGIVKGSVPASEWEELEQKINPITSLIGNSNGKWKP